MKKILFAITMVAMGTVCAQSPKWGYGDTVYGQINPDTTYFYQWWCEGLGPQTNTFLTLVDYTPAFQYSAWLVQYNYTDTPLEVAGIAACINGLDSRYPGQHDIALDMQEYLLLFDATPDSFPLKAQVPYDLTTPHRYMHISCQHAGNGCCDNDEHIWFSECTMALREYYFEKPITVTDSFYVGATYYSVAFWNPQETGRLIPRNQPSYASIKRTIRDDCSVDCPQMPLQKHKLWRKGYWDTVYRDEPYFLLVFPLLAPDTSLPECPRISGLYTRGNYTDTVTVQWAYDSLHQEFELSYGREGTRPEEGTIVTVFDNRWQFSDTAYSDTPMVAYVRTVCRENDTLRWSGWSSPVYWRLHHVADDTTHLEGITVPDEESNLSHYVQLMPNPASEKVMVLSSYGIDRMEVFDVRGKRMLEQSVSERQPMADFDVSTWTKGAYVVFVYTPAGTVAKRLVVK